MFNYMNFSSVPSRVRLLSSVLIGSLVVLVATIIVARTNESEVSPQAKASEPQSTYARSMFPLGVFEDGNMMGGNVTTMSNMVTDLKNHNLDTIMLGNGGSTRDNNMLTEADKTSINILYSPAVQLNSQWWSNSIPATYDNAIKAIKPVTDLLKSHKSIKSWYLADEPALTLAPKIALAQQVFHEQDPNRPTFPVLVEASRVNQIGSSVNPDAYVLDVYPVGALNGLCNFSMTGFGYPGSYDYTDYMRDALAHKPTGTPLWMILQTHNFLKPGDRFALRTPSVEEVRLQHWLALGEGAHGILWFVYSSQQGWTGIKDNPTLYNEISNLAAKTQVYKSVYLKLNQNPAIFTSKASQGKQFAKTFKHSVTGQYFAIVVNRSCNAQSFSVGQGSLAGNLMDAYTGQTYTPGQAISFNGGEGKLLALVGNNATRGGFNGIDASGVVTGWALDPDAMNASTVVEAYVDGVKGAGKLMGTYTANLPRPDVNTAFGYAGNHGFRWTVPLAYQDGKAHSVYIYARESGASVSSNTPLGGSPKSFTLSPSIKLSGTAYCINSVGAKVNWANEQIVMVKNGVTTKLATADVNGAWTVTRKANDLAGARIKPADAEYPTASIPDFYSGQNNGIKCPDSNIEGISFNATYTSIVETLRCKRTVPFTSVNFNLGNCKVSARATSIPDPNPEVKASFINPQNQAIYTLDTPTSYMGMACWGGTMVGAKVGGRTTYTIPTSIYTSSLKTFPDYVWGDRCGVYVYAPANYKILGVTPVVSLPVGSPTPPFIQAYPVVDSDTGASGRVYGWSTSDWYTGQRSVKIVMVSITPTPTVVPTVTLTPTPTVTPIESPSPTLEPTVTATP